MTIEFHCPHCGKFLRTSDDRAGALAKCPDCGERITVPQPEEHAAAGDEFGIEPVRAPQGSHEADDAGLPPSVPAAPGDTKQCPMCGETIRAGAIRCRFCGEDLGTRAGSAAEPWRSTPFDAGEVISTSWEIYKERFGIIFGTGALLMILNYVISLPQTVIQMAAENARGDDLTILIVAWIVCYLLGVLVQTWLMAGMAIFLLKAARNADATVGDLFSGGRYFLRALGNTILFYIITMLGTLACIVPGVLLTLMFWPYLFVLVDSDARGLQPLARAKEITNANWGSGFVLMLTALGLHLLGFLMCCFGVFATAPLAMLLFAVAYCRMTGQR